MKKCNKCYIKKELSNYPKRKNSLDGYRNTCKACTNKNKKQRYHDNADIRKTEQQRHAEYYCNNKNKIKKQTKLYKRKSRQQVEIRLRDNLRNRLNQALNKNQKTGSDVRDLGCSIVEFKVYIESLWQEGMTWENWTKDGWHIDHIKSLSNFNLTDPREFKKACHYTNLQPLWARDNWSKG